MKIDNQSPWPFCILPQWGLSRKMQPSLVIKTGYQWDSFGNLIELEPDEICLETSDRFYNDDAEHQSLAASADTVPFKEGFEIFLYGSAHVNKPQPYIDVSATLKQENNQEIWHKQCRVFGKRVWQRTLLGWLASDAEPFESLTLNYEKAFGGHHPNNEDNSYALNPVGLGYKAPLNKQLPQIEQAPYIKSPRQKRLPAGFGPIAPNWLPRSARLRNLNADAAVNGSCPYSWPIDTLLFNSAPEDQILSQAPPLNSELILCNFNRERPLQKIQLPPTAPVAMHKNRALPLVWDTLIIDTDNQRLYQLWRAVIAIPITELAALSLTIATNNNSSNVEVA